MPEAVEIPVIAAESPSDEYLDFVRAETLRTLNPTWKKALAADRQVDVDRVPGEEHPPFAVTL